MSRPLHEILVLITASAIMALMVLVSGEMIARTSPQVNARLTMPIRSEPSATSTEASACWATDYPCRP
jgi:hypothetical protein